MRLDADWRLRGYAALTLLFTAATYGLVAAAAYATVTLVRRYVGPVESVAVAALFVAAAAAGIYQFATPRAVLDRLDARPAAAAASGSASAAAPPEAVRRARASLERLSQQAGVPAPELWVADREAPTSLSAGYTRRSPVVCLTSGLLETLDPTERDAVLAHEVAHVANRDGAVVFAAMLPSAILGAAAGVAFLALSLSGVAGLVVGADAGGLLGVLVEQTLALSLAVLAVAAPVSVLGSALVARFARGRELAADRTAAALTGNPAALATALEALADADAELDLVSEGSRAGEFFVLPVDDEDANAHPELDRRVERLRRLEREFETR